MYEFVRGQIVKTAPTRVVVDVNGVGYALEIPLSTFEALPASGEVTLLAHLHVREDVQKLFGFATSTERDLFNMLQKVSGVGPGLALTILSRASCDEIRDAILQERVDYLKSLKGIGPKTAARLITELKDRVGALGLGSDASALPTVTSVEMDAVQALQVLGYTPKASQKAVRKAYEKGPGATVGDLVRAALKLV